MAAAAVEGTAVAVLRSVMFRVREAATRARQDPERVRVVAVSKTKPISLIRQVYDAGHRYFGENYAQEIMEKAPQAGVFFEQLPEDIEWHFVGHLQSNKVKSLLAKSGVDPTRCVEVAKHIKQCCPNLLFSGFMTIGMPDYTSTPENFRTLSNCRTEVCNTLGLKSDQLELSMGMSGDFEKAIEMGSTNVRIGSTIFGPREYPKKQ